jgi:hypothetical protein
VTSVLNFSQLLRIVPDEFRGRVFSTLESLTWATMMLSMTAAGIASKYAGPRTLGLWSGVLSASTAFVWTWMNLTRRLPQPSREGIEPDEIEVHGEPTV